MQLTIQEEITLQSRDIMMLVLSKVSTQQSVPLWQTRLVTLKTDLLPQQYRQVLSQTLNSWNSILER